MARLAGDGTHYRVKQTLTYLDHKGNPTDYVVERGYELPSVTTIIDAVIAKPALYRWYYTKGLEGVSELFDKYGDKLPHDYDSLQSLLTEEKLSPFSRRDQAADTGRSTHAQLEDLVWGRDVGRSATTAGILDWWARRGLTAEHVEACEVPLAHVGYGYAGTVDIVYVDPVSGDRVLCDLKTGKGVYWTHFLQGEAYRLAWEESFPDKPIARVSVLHAPTTGILTRKRTFREVVTDNITADDFLKVLEIYNAIPKKFKLRDV